MFARRRRLRRNCLQQELHIKISNPTAQQKINGPSLIAKYLFFAAGERRPIYHVAIPIKMMYSRLKIRFRAKAQLVFDLWLYKTRKSVFGRSQSPNHSRPQSPSFLGHVVGYKLSRVALGARMNPNIADTSECACYQYQRWYQPRPQKSLLCNLVTKGRDPFGQRQGSA